MKFLILFIGWCILFILCWPGISHSQLDEILSLPVLKKGLFTNLRGLGYLYMMHFVSVLPNAAIYS